MCWGLGGLARGQGVHRLFFISIVTCNNIFVTHNIFRFIIVCFPIVGEYLGSLAPDWLGDYCPLGKVRLLAGRKDFPHCSLVSISGKLAAASKRLISRINYLNILMRWSLFNQAQLLRDTKVIVLELLA